MAARRWFVIAMLLVAMPHAAGAQGQTPGNGDPVDSHWLVSGLAGLNFEQDAEEASGGFGAAVGYLWRGMFGPELSIDVSPAFDLEPGRSAILADNPVIVSYMANAVGAIPLGPEGRWRPYVSGGLGALTVRSDALDEEDDPFEIDDSRAAGNVGFGLLVIPQRVGVRADVRYYRGFESDLDRDPVEDAAEAVGDLVLSELSFWRANVGVVFRW